jgi:hypothetical protein
MKNFVFLYSGGTAPTTPAEGEASMKEWMAWFEGLGASVKEAGEAFSGSTTVTKSGQKAGPGGNISNGYSVMKADSMDDAAKLAKTCPIIAQGGAVHVFEVMAM